MRGDGDGLPRGVVSWLGDATAGMPWDGTGGGDGNKCHNACFEEFEK